VLARQALVLREVARRILGREQPIQFLEPRREAVELGT